MGGYGPIRSQRVKGNVNIQMFFKPSKFCEVVESLLFYYCKFYHARRLNSPSIGQGVVKGQCP